ncbi:MAG: DUF3194 domain-containing protein [Candidatus Bathyarchaeota archaeon]|nr:DUF3194 domain-containing protein [Candidatus Bathyarchaeota archaeon]
MEDLGIPELTSEEIEELCVVAEKAAREYVTSKVPSKRIETLNISVKVEDTKPVTVTIDVDVVLSPLMKDFDVKGLAEEAIKEAFASIDKYLRALKCHSQE